MEKRRILRSIKKELMSLPDNKNIERISDNIYTINFSDLDDFILSPQHYNFTKTYEYIYEYLEKAEVGEIRKRLDEIIKKKKFKMKYQLYTVHKEIVNNLKKILQ